MLCEGVLRHTLLEFINNVSRVVVSDVLHLFVSHNANPKVVL